MSQMSHNELQQISNAPSEKMAAMADMPCHETMMVSSIPGASYHTDAEKLNQQKPCCPDKQCSPQNCLMHFAIASLPMLEIVPHSPLDSRIFLDTNIHVVSVPVTERFRPPIA